jgi:aminotransferase EvaB
VKLPINVWEYLEDFKSEKDEVLEIVAGVLSSGKLVLGSEVEAFENEFSRYIGVDYGIGVNSGTDAIKIALKGLGIGSGDEVITTSNTAVPTVSAIRETGADVVFVDVQEDTYNLDPSLIEAQITPKTKAIVAVHLYGHCVDIEEIISLANKYELKVVEDCAQSHGALFKGRRAGSFGHVSAFSFYPTKILGGFGDGGAICTASSELAKKFRKLRFYGMSSSYFSEIEGYNSRLDELHAAILRYKLKKLDFELDKRKNIAQMYSSELADCEDLVLPVTKPDHEHAYYVYVVRHKRRDECLELLKAESINLNISYPWPIHTMPPYKKFVRHNTSLRITELIQKEIFSLPMFPGLGPERQSYVIEKIRDICKKLH